MNTRKKVRRAITVENGGVSLTDLCVRINEATNELIDRGASRNAIEMVPIAQGIMLQATAPMELFDLIREAMQSETAMIGPVIEAVNTIIEEAPELLIQEVRDASVQTG